MRRIALPLLFAGALFAQVPNPPLIHPRGVVNAYTQAPAPANVGRGGIVQINGLNLGPAEGATASGASLPTELAGVRVLLRGNPVPIYSVGPGRILAQVPPDADTGLAEVVVRRGEQTSRPALFTILPIEPSLQSTDGSGYGPAGNVSGGVLLLTATGLEGEPRLSAYVGGLPARIAAAAGTRPGETELRVELPGGARPGDVVAVLANSRWANPVTYGTLSQADVQLLPLGDGAPPLTALSDTDVNGGYLIANGAAVERCHPAVLLDFRLGRASNLDGCYVATTRAAATPFIAPVPGVSLGSLVGPAQGEAPAGVSSQLRIFGPGREPVTVALPAAANLLGTIGSDFLVNMPDGAPRAVRVDAETGGIGPLAEGAQGRAMPLGGINVDGMTHPLSAPVALGRENFAMIVADDANEPKRYKFAVFNDNAEAILTKDFPEGWQPMLLPLAGGVAGRPGAGAGQPALTAPREPAAFDAVGRTYFALAKSADGGKQAFVAFPLDRNTPAGAVPFPDNWYAATCSPIFRLFDLQLTRRIALAAGNAPESEARTPCMAAGFLQLDLAGRSLSAIPLPGQARMNVATITDVNDYVFGTNLEPAPRRPVQTADTVFVLDGTAGTVFTMNAASEITGFAQLQPIPRMSALIGAATNREAGDQGLLFFDLEQGTVTVLPTPEGFTSVTEVGFFPATRKLVARARRAPQSQLVVYDLRPQRLGELSLVPNPEGVTVIGGVPPVAPGVGQVLAPTRLLIPNERANTVAGLAQNAEFKQVGVALLRVP